MSAALPERDRRMDFVLERTGRNWRVRGPSDRCGGLFASREAALDFMRREGRALTLVRPYRPPGSGTALQTPISDGPASAGGEEAPRRSR